MNTHIYIVPTTHKIFLLQIHYFFWKNLPKISTIAYNMKICLRFFYFHILNIAKLIA
jgi:hypothetical protein